MRICLILVLLLASTDQIFSQYSSDSLELNIRLIKEYQVAHSKEYYEFMYRSELLNITKDTVQEKRFDIEVAIRNSSSKSMFIWLMSTYWEQNFRINNNYIYFNGRDIDHNFPRIVQIKPGESKLYYATLVKSIKFDSPCTNCIYGKQVETTKLGLIIIDDVFNPKLDGLWGYYLAMEDESAWKTIWSNPLYLLTKEEANPTPIEIPVYKNE